METPHISHITTDDYQFVYEPAEDSFLLLDALETDLPKLINSKPTVCAEIGSGSGVIITAVAKSLPESLCFAIDINPRACIVTKRTAQVNGANVEVVNMNLLAAFLPRSIDLLLFNPPYVVTPDEEINDGTSNQVNANIVKSWAGGTFGRIIIDEFIHRLDDTLTSNGIAYLLVIKENKPEEIIDTLKKIQFSARIIAERRIRGEHLFVLKIIRA